MDYRQFISRLAAQTGRDTRSLMTAVEALGTALARGCSEMDTVAIPGFGSFSAVKTDERVEADSTTKKRTLYPPEIKAEFRPSVILRKRMAER
ncbi:MAG: HU family DNA-binding protein [Pseudoflavonifractor sp.]|nr:HU family DNA-binding protein [Alloprevotella sp.]MCM1116272.1 HU family DNA-binding protein [Pseudoflavonifractor sp.]